MPAPGTAAHDQWRAHKARKEGRRSANNYALMQGLGDLFQGAHGFVQQRQDQQQATDVARFMAPIAGGKATPQQGFQVLANNPDMYSGRTQLELLGQLQGLQAAEADQRIADQKASYTRALQTQAESGAELNYARAQDVRNNAGAQARKDQASLLESRNRRRIELREKLDKTFNDRRLNQRSVLDPGELERLTNLQGQLNSDYADLNDNQRSELESAIAEIEKSRAERTRFQRTNDQRLTNRGYEISNRLLTESRRGGKLPKVSQVERSLYNGAQGVMTGQWSMDDLVQGAEAIRSKRGAKKFQALVGDKISLALDMRRLSQAKPGDIIEGENGHFAEMTEEDIAALQQLVVEDKELATMIIHHLENRGWED